MLSSENLTCTNTFHSHTTQRRPRHLLPTLVKSFPLHQDTLLHPLNIFTADSLSSSSHYFSALPLGDINSYLWNHSSSLVAQSFDLFYSKDGDLSHSSPRSYLWSYHFQKLCHSFDFRHHHPLSLWLSPTSTDLQRSSCGCSYHLLTVSHFLHVLTSLPTQLQLHGQSFIWPLSSHNVG